MSSKNVLQTRFWIVTFTPMTLENPDRNCPVEAVKIGLLNSSLGVRNV